MEVDLIKILSEYFIYLFFNIFVFFTFFSMLNFYFFDKAGREKIIFFENQINVLIEGKNKIEFENYLLKEKINDWNDSFSTRESYAKENLDLVDKDEVCFFI